MINIFTVHTLKTVGKYALKYAPEIATIATAFFTGMAVVSAVDEAEDIKEAVTEFREDKEQEPLSRRVIRILKAAKKTIIFFTLALTANILGWYAAKKQITALAALLATSQALNDKAFKKLEELVPDEKARDELLNDIYSEDDETVELPDGKKAQMVNRVVDTGTGDGAWNDRWCGCSIIASEDAIDRAILEVYRRALAETNAGWNIFYEHLGITPPDSSYFRVWSADRLMNTPLERVKYDPDMALNKPVRGQIPRNIIVRPECDIVGPA